MKIVVLILAVALGCFLVARQKPAARSVTAAVPAASPTPSPNPQGAAATPTALRRPIARTQEVLGEVQQRNGAGEF